MENLGESVLLELLIGDFRSDIDNPDPAARQPSDPALRLKPDTATEAAARSTATPRVPTMMTTDFKSRIIRCYGVCNDRVRKPVLEKMKSIHQRHDWTGSRRKRKKQFALLILQFVRVEDRYSIEMLRTFS